MQRIHLRIIIDLLVICNSMHLVMLEMSVLKYRATNSDFCTDTSFQFFCELDILIFQLIHNFDIFDISIRTYNTNGGGGR